jgi:hypothetical protein
MAMRMLGMLAATIALAAPATAAGEDALFAKYPSGAVYKGKPAAVDLGSHKDARTFRTRLREGAAKGPNFAAHYTVIQIGCGTMCQLIAVVDSRNGKVHTPLPRPASLGVAHRLDSRLLIVNTPENVRETPNAKELGVATEYYVWNDGKLTKLARP